MLRKVGLTTALLLALPAFANAWTLSAKVGSGAGTITSSAVAGKEVTKTATGAPVIGYFRADDNSTQTITLTALDGYRLSTVLVDGVQKTPTAQGTVDISSGKANHTLVAYYSAIGSSLSVTTIVGGGGSVTVQPLKADGTAFGAISRSGFSSLKTGAKVRLTATPNGDYTLDKLYFNGVSQPVLYKGVLGDVPYADVTIISGANTATATFLPVAKVTARIAVGQPVISVNGYAGWNSSQFYKVNELIPLDVSKSTGTGTVTYSFKAYLPDGKTEASGATFTGLTGVQFANAGQYIVQVTADNGAKTATATTPLINVVSESAANNSSCVGCHSQRNPAVVTATSSCSGCHGPATNNAHNNGNVSAATTKFSGSKHWNNHFEYGPEFTEGPVTGQLNPNESYTTKEDGALVTCWTKCHFKNTPQLDGRGQKGVYGCQACHSDGLLNDGKFKNASSAHGEKTLAVDNTCYFCHSGSKHGKVPNEFFASKHWQNSFENGPEFANQMDTTVTGGDATGKTYLGGKVTYNGTNTDGYLNANDSYTTTEDGGAVTCAYRCHFRPGMGPNKNVAGYLVDGKATSYVMYSSPYGAGRFYRPGGDSCMACHDPHGLDANARSTCYTCHAGGKHGWSVKAYEKGSHFTGQYAIADGMGGPTGEACTACHNAHSTEAVFFTMSSSSASVESETGCQKCHTPGSTYSVYAADRTGKAPHFQTGTADANGFYPTASYIQPTAAVSASCADCHSHNNSVNAGWAEGGHGDVTTEVWNSSSSHIWLDRGDSANFQQSPQVTNCVRCHSTQGFVQFVDSGFTSVAKIQNSDGTPIKDSSPLTCNGCHTNTDKGSLRLANFTTASKGAKGYKAFWGYSNAKYVDNTKAAKSKIVSSIQLLDNRNSNLCMPCHSQRASGDEIKAVYAAATALGITSIGSNIYPHAAQPAAIWAGKGGYEFTTNSATSTYRDRMNHQRIGNGFNGDKGTGVIGYTLTNSAGYNNTGITQGSCVACHMTGDDTHSLEITDTTFTKTCYKCHPSNFTQADVDAKKAEFDAAVVALGNLLVKKGITKDGINPLPERNTFDMSLGTSDAVKAEKNTGAWFNWYLFSTADKAAYAHNPAYARRLIYDSIDWLDNNQIDGTAASTVLSMGLVGNPLFNSAVNVKAAISFSNDPGCMGCHYGGSVNVANGENVPGIEKAPHFNPAAPAQQNNTAYNAQYLAANSQCNYCHGFGHGTDNPGGTINEDWAENHGKVDAKAFAEENFKGNNCNVCHTTTGFIKYVTSDHNLNAAAWGTANDATRETVACNACHSSTGWKTEPGHAVRQFNSYSAGMGGMGSNAKYKVSYDKVVNGVDVVKTRSGVCIVCHAGREDSQSLYGGGLLGSAATNFSNTSFKGAHYLPSAGVFYAKSGFKYYTDPTKYTANQRHTNLGMNNYSSVGLITASTLADPAYAPFIGAGTTVGARRVSYSTNTGDGGPCVACHMGPAGHTLSPENMISAMPASAAPSLVIPAGSYGCYGCHRTENTKTLIEEVKEEQSAALEYIRLLLESVGVYYNPVDNPYFVTSAGADPAVNPVKDWNGLAQKITGDVVSGDKLLGAAHNFKLITSDKGAYVHNHGFTARLLFDTVDFLQNGSIKGTAKLDNTNPVFNAFSTANPGKAGLARNLLTDGKASTVINGTPKARP